MSRGTESQEIFMENEEKFLMTHKDCGSTSQLREISLSFEN